MNRFALAPVRGCTPGTFNGVGMRLAPELSRHFFGYDIVYEVQPFRALERLVRPGMTAFDIGANIGIMSVLMAKLAGPGGRVCSFEPHPSNYALLERNMGLNAAGGWHGFQVLVGDRVQPAVPFFIDDDNFGASSSLIHKESNSRVIEVPMLTLDALAGERGLWVPDVIKLDVEGAEIDVVRGGRIMLGGHHPLIVCEVHGMILEEAGKTVADLFGLLEELGYVPVNLHKGCPDSTEEFARDTGFRIEDQHGQDLGSKGLGHVVFSPRERLRETLNALGFSG